MLYIGQKVGMIDLVLVPSHPEVLYAASFDRSACRGTLKRRARRGIYKTSNGGHTWTQLGGGLPTGNIGRIGLDVFARIRASCTR